MVEQAIAQLLRYAQAKKLIEPADTIWARNLLLQTLALDTFDDTKVQMINEEVPLVGILAELIADAGTRGVLDISSVTECDLFDTKLMACLTPKPSEVYRAFGARYQQSPRKATDWYYSFSQDTNYIRVDRMRKDIRWVSQTQFGEMVMTINLSKPEKDPKAIAAQKHLPKSAYPRCQLCAENEGYAGRINHPARGNHRIIPIDICGEQWFFQYSPYVYYNEHAIALSGDHHPMIIDKACFEKLLAFVRVLPHYFVGSNADLPIVGGSILAHEHFQAGNFSFPMEKASVETTVAFENYPNVEGGIVAWPMSVLRLICTEVESLTSLADDILQAWKEYSDPSVGIFAHSGEERHNTITPIARFRDGKYELDLVLRNNITTEEFPHGVFHAHAEHHHIKKENIGLIEVMGLAVLPSRLKNELQAVGEAMVAHADLRKNEMTAHHADWAESICKAQAVTKENVQQVLRQEVANVFADILAQAGVFKRNDTGKNAFLRFVKSVAK